MPGRVGDSATDEGYGRAPAGRLEEGTCASDLQPADRIQVEPTPYRRS